MAAKTGAMSPLGPEAPVATLPLLHAPTATLLHHVMGHGHNRVPATWYFNLTGKVWAGADKRYEFFWAVHNLLDQDPRATPYFVLNAPVNGQYYDKIGRRYTAGVRIRL